MAVPRKRTGTAFCTTSVKTAKVGPMPRPVTSHPEPEHRARACPAGCSSAGTGRGRSRAGRRRSGPCSARSPPRSGRRRWRRRSARQQRQDLVAGLGRRGPVHDLEPARQEDDRGEEAHRRQEEGRDTLAVKAGCGTGRAARSARFARDSTRRRRRPSSRPSAIRPPTSRIGPFAELLVGEADEERHQRQGEQRCSQVVDVAVHVRRDREVGSVRQMTTSTTGRSAR